MDRKIKKSLSLQVALEYLKANKKTNPRLVEELEKITAEYQGRDRVLDDHQERKRVERQRTLFTMLPASASTDQLKEAMISRAWHLLDVGQCESCDALLEFLPSADADKMLAEYFEEEG